MKDITKEIALNATEFFHRSMSNKGKTPLKVRRNGKTQVWKTRPNEFRIPVKYGLYEYYNITDKNCHEWYVN